MPRLKETSIALLQAKVPVAVSDGWTVKRLAAACFCGERAAREALARYRQAMASELAESSGSMLAMMQREAAQERPAVIRRLREAGASADALLAKAQEAIEELQIGGSVVDAEDESEDDQPSTRGRCSSSVEARLASLAAVVKAAASAARESWLCFKDASGIEFAEDLARVRAKAAAQSANTSGAVLVPNVVVEIDG
ncbi:MAG: hypothetical protein JNM99_09475 [Verrucomicrobiaceae bacterium]|nr:hypothetical protein [Verrucomicrobiaceae bacterium]